MAARNDFRHVYRSAVECRFDNDDQPNGNPGHRRELSARRSGQLEWQSTWTVLHNTALQRDGSSLRKSRDESDELLFESRACDGSCRPEHRPAECRTRTVGFTRLEPDLWAGQLELRCEPSETDPDWRIEERGDPPGRQKYLQSPDARKSESEP